MNQRCLDLSTLLLGQLAWLGPDARSLSVHVLAPWTFVRMGLATDAGLRTLAVDFGLDLARTERHGRVWYRRAHSRQDGLIVIAAGPYHSGDEETTR